MNVEATGTPRLMVGATDRDPALFALHSGRIGSATHHTSRGSVEIPGVHGIRPRAGGGCAYVILAA